MELEAIDHIFAEERRDPVKESLRVENGLTAQLDSKGRIADELGMENVRIARLDDK